jgi:hypothetical protein
LKFAGATLAFVDVKKEELEARFRDLSDEELLGRLDYDLTPLAREAVTAELKSRGIQPPSAFDSGDASVDGSINPDDANIDVVTVATYWDLTQATLACECLKACDVPAYVWGEHLGAAHLLLSVATGGMKVQVRSDQLEEAKEIIAAFERGEIIPQDEPDSDPAR